MSREALETNQVAVYAAALALGGVVGWWQPWFGARVEPLIAPVLAVLLYSMFCQIPFLHLREAFGNGRYTAALMVVNFVVVPLVVWSLSFGLPDHLPLLLGVFLVLLTPCIDYVIPFTHMGRGNAHLVLASTPLLLLAQMALLPLYLRMFLGRDASEVMRAGPFLEAFVVLILLPLVLAVLTELWAARQRGGRVWRGATTWLPVPFMALTLLLVVASQVVRIGEHLPLVAHAVPVYVAFMVIMPIVARIAMRVFRLSVADGRALVFSTATRNSLVVLPLALALGDAWLVVPAVIVTQTLVELVGEVVYVRVVPRFVVRDP